MPIPDACERGFRSSHGGGTRSMDSFERGVIQRVNEFRHRHAGFLRAAAHGELVAKVANRGEAHARQAQVLAESGRVLRDRVNRERR